MKNVFYFLLFIILNVSIIRCGPDPIWKKRGYDSESEYNEWLASDKKFVGEWFCKKTYEPYGLVIHYNLNLLENGQGLFSQNYYSGGALGRGINPPEATFNWKKVNDSTIQVYNLYGRYNLGEYEFEKFNGEYIMNLDKSDTLKLGDEYSFLNLSYEYK